MVDPWPELYCLQMIYIVCQRIIERTVLAIYGSVRCAFQEPRAEDVSRVRGVVADLKIDPAHLEFGSQFAADAGPVRKCIGRQYVDSPKAFSIPPWRYLTTLKQRYRRSLGIH